MLRFAIKEAQKSSYRFKLGAIITRKGKIVGRGHNSIRYSKFSHPSFPLSLHAEAAAIKSLKGKGDTIYVVRVNHSGSLGMACPCGNCMRLIVGSHIRWVVFSNSSGTLVRKRVNDLLYEQAESTGSDYSDDEEPQLYWRYI